MKHGTDVCKNRKKLYNLIINHYEYINAIQLINETHYIITFVDMKTDAMFGFSRTGEWIFKDNEKLYLIKEKKMFLYCSKMIEVPYETIQRYIYDKFHDVISMENISFYDFFPFYEIVEFIFCNFFDDYWLDLAWLWYEKLDFSEQKQLVDTLVSISKVKRISQRNRQRIKREVERVMKVANNI